MKSCVLLLSILLFGCAGIFDMNYMCEHSADPSMKDKCFSYLAFRDDNTTTCKNINNATMREYCVMRIAISDLNESRCNDMETYLKMQCDHVVMGLRQNNSLVCRLVQDNETAELCRMRVV